jgi:hypothetical protein
MKDQIIQYLVLQLEKSLVGYEVNGNPVKRHFLLLNIALSQYLKMTNAKRKKIYYLINKQSNKK